MALCKPFPMILNQAKTIPTSTQRHAWMLPWLCFDCSCGAFERSEFRRQKNSGRSHTEKNQLQCPCAQPFPWILRRVKTIPTSTQHHAWMLPWLCLDCSCGAFERGEFRRQKSSGRSHTETIQLQCPCARPSRGYCAESRRSPRRHSVDAWYCFAMHGLSCL